jgi:hypothetical protein
MPKRKAPAARQRPPKRRAAGPAPRDSESGGSESDDGLGDSEAAVLQEERDARRFWEQWETPLLAAWILDWKQPVPDRGDRDALITRLVVERAQLQMPEPATALEQLQVAWRKRIGKQKDAVAPGRWGRGASLAPPAAEQPERASPSDADRDEIGGGQRPQAMQAAFDDLRARHDALVARLEATPAVADKAPAAAAARAPVLGTPSPVQCRVCAEPAPDAPPLGPFRCGVCGLRGDLDADDPTQRLILSALGRDGGAASSSSASSAAAPQGPSPGQSEAGAAAAVRALPALGARERIYAECMTYPSTAAFDTGDPAASAAAAAAAQDAFEKGRSAYNAGAYVARAPALVRLVQAGKLIDLGYALPVEIAKGGAAASSGHLVPNADGTWRPAKADEPAAIRSSADLFRAFVATIVPALAGQPRALAEWAALMLSVTEIEMANGWAAAYTVLTQQLHAAVQQGRPIGDLSVALLHGVLLRGGGASGRGGGGGGAGVGTASLASASTARAHGLCINYNNNKGCARVPCRFPHKCIACGGNHPEIACSGGGQRPQSVGGGRGGRARKSGASSVATVPAPAAAASGAASVPGGGKSV